MRQGQDVQAVESLPRHPHQDLRGARARGSRRRVRRGQLAPRDVRRRQAGVPVGRVHRAEDTEVPGPRVRGQRGDVRGGGSGGDQRRIRSLREVLRLQEQLVGSDTERRGVERRGDVRGDARWRVPRHRRRRRRVGEDARRSSRSDPLGRLGAPGDEPRGVGGRAVPARGDAGRSNVPSGRVGRVGHGGVSGPRQRDGKGGREADARRRARRRGIRRWSGRLLGAGGRARGRGARGAPR
mmetsp:Transcript_7447/g.32851  ORF Transcript_7447/g.32851 Transcript_7447/m.32851 type:complete len:239 (+) Transcript_7447:264-980(+)